MRLWIIYIKNTWNWRPNVIFDNKLEEIEYKGERFKCYYAKVTYIPDYCESCGVCNTNYSIVKKWF